MASSFSFSDYIRMLPASWVFEHFLKKGGARRKILSSSAVQECIERFSAPEILKQRFASLAAAERRALAFAYVMGGRGIGSQENDIDINDPLLRSFLVYACRSKDGQVRYFGFDEFEPHLRGVIAHDMADAACSRPAAVFGPVKPEYMVNDIAAVLTLGWQGVLEKKKQGGLMRSAVQKITRLVRERPGAKKEDALAQLLIHCCTVSGLLEENAEQYHCVSSACTQWFERTVEERAQELRDTAIAFAGSWRLSLLHEILGAVDREQWFSTGLFPQSEQESIAAMLCQLSWAGIIAITDGNGDTFFRTPASYEQPVTENGSPSRSNPAEQGISNGRPLTVLPDFSAIIRPDTPAIDLFRLGQTGALHSLDRVYKGSIERTILSDSLARGVDGNEVLAWLAGWEAPSNVTITVQEWIREFNRLCVTTGAMLLVCDEKVEYQLTAFEPLCGLVEKVPAHAVYRIRPGSEEQVRTVLGSMGFDDRMPRRDALRQKEPASLPFDTWEPILTEQAQGTGASLALRGKKYGAGLKSFDLNETIHIIDYAILTGQELVFEYDGSPYVKKGTYTVQPRSCTKGADPMLEVAEHNGRSRRFMVRNISAIGVGHS